MSEWKGMFLFLGIFGLGLLLPMAGLHALFAIMGGG